MEVAISSVDHAPEDLYGQVPIRARLVRLLPGSDRPDYWLAELFTPISWTTDGTRHLIRHLVIAARWVGTSIRSGTELPVNIAYVTDESQVVQDSLDFKKTAYVAIGMATVTEAAS